MPMVAEAVPGFLHTSLFLFFVGLGDSLLNINTKVALSTIVPIGISGLLYILITFVPIIYPKSPYRNSFSRIFCYLFQKSRGRKLKDRRPDGEMKSVGTDMAQGQMQLAMEETEARKDRDVQAIRWLIDNLTEDAEMERFLSAIPGSFNTDWGAEVWKRVGEYHESDDQSRSILRPIIHLVRKLVPYHSPTPTTCPPVPNQNNVHPHSTTAHIQGEDVVHELSTRVARSVEICKNRKRFSNNDDLWQKRTRACIEATAPLVCCANAKLAWFGDVSKLLRDISSFEEIRELSLAGTDELFVIRWSCLSFVAIRLIFEDLEMMIVMGSAIGSISKGDDDEALAVAQKIDKTHRKATDCLFWLYNELPRTEDLTEVIESLRGHQSQISELEQINIEAGCLEVVDDGISMLQSVFNTSQIPGVHDHFDAALIPFSRFVEVFQEGLKMQFIRPRQTLKGTCSLALTLRNILEGQGDADAYKKLLKNLGRIPFWFGWQDVAECDAATVVASAGSDLWRTWLYGRAFLPCILAAVIHISIKGITLCTIHGHFRAITSDRSYHNSSLGTQNLLLIIAWTRREEFVGGYPAYIVDEFLLLLGNTFKGQTGPHIDKARQQFESFRPRDSIGFKERVLKVLTRG